MDRADPGPLWGPGGGPGVSDGLLHEGPDGRHRTMAEKRLPGQRGAHCGTDAEIREGAVKKPRTFRRTGGNEIFRKALAKRVPGWYNTNGRDTDER